MPAAPVPSATEAVINETPRPSSAPKETQVHVLVGCADAREVGQVHIDAVTTVQREYGERGIRILFHVIRTPGAFITDDVLADIRRIITLNEAEHYAPASPPRYFVYIQAHGALVDAPADGCYTGATPALRIQPGSPLNCGMLGATGVALEIEELLLLLKPTLSLPDGRTIKIYGENDVRTLLREVYDHDGFFAGDWVKSIDDLRTHARAQKSLLERAALHDPDMRRLNLTVSAGIQDYANRRVVRLDCSDGELHFWDDVHDFIHARWREQGKLDGDFAAMGEKQNPIAGLFAMDDPSFSPRDRAARWFMRRAGLPETDYRPNLLFTLGGSAFDHPRTPFGPYNIAGFFYAAKYLGIEKFIVAGKDAAQTRRMVAKIGNCPLTAFLVRELGVELLPVTAEELDALEA